MDLQTILLTAGLLFLSYPITTQSPIQPKNNRLTESMGKLPLLIGGIITLGARTVACSDSEAIPNFKIKLQEFKYPDTIPRYPDPILLFGGTKKLIKLQQEIIYLENLIESQINRDLVNALKANGAYDADPDTKVLNQIYDTKTLEISTTRLRAIKNLSSEKDFKESELTLEMGYIFAKLLLYHDYLIKPKEWKESDKDYLLNYCSFYVSNCIINARDPMIELLSKNYDAHMIIIFKFLEHYKPIGLKIERKILKLENKLLNNQLKPNDLIPYYSKDGLPNKPVQEVLEHLKELRLYNQKAVYYCNYALLTLFRKSKDFMRKGLSDENFTKPNSSKATPMSFEDKFNYLKNDILPAVTPKFIVLWEPICED